MSFAEVRLESDFIVYGTKGGPGYNTNVIVVNSGFEFRNKNWDKARGRWEFGARKVRSSELHNIIAFFRARGGKFQGFRFKDWGDYTATHNTLTEWSVTTQGVVVNASTTTAYLHKAYTSGSDTEFRQITKPVASTIVMYKDGVQMTPTTDWTLDSTTGLATFTFTLGTHAISWDGEFDVPVRFDTDELRAELIAGQPGMTNPQTLTETYHYLDTLPIVEIRV